MMFNFLLTDDRTINSEKPIYLILGPIKNNMQMKTSIRSKQIQTGS